MAVVTFWNNNTGKIGQTYSAIAIATHMAIEHNYSVLLISTRYNDQTTMEAFGFTENIKTISSLTQNKSAMDLESGIEGITKLANAGKLTPDLIPNYTRVVLKNRLEILSGSQGREEEIDYARMYLATKNLINVARQKYDIVLVDLNNSFNEEPTREALRISDVIVLNFEQKMSEFRKLAELKKEEKELFSKKNHLLLINRYDREDKYSSKNLTRTLNEKQEILTVPYNNLFGDAVQEGNVAELFLNPRIRKPSDNEEKTTFFINELKRAEEAIIYKIQELQMRI